MMCIQSDLASVISEAQIAVSWASFCSKQAKAHRVRNEINLNSVVLVIEKYVESIKNSSCFILEAKDMAVCKQVYWRLLSLHNCQMSFLLLYVCDAVHLLILKQNIEASDFESFF